jgi:hypothetical protein
MYRIAWFSHYTGLLGRGDYIFSNINQAVIYALEMNRNFGGMLEHWVEEQPPFPPNQQ